MGGAGERGFCRKEGCGRVSLLLSGVLGLCQHSLQSLGAVPSAERDSGRICSLGTVQGPERGCLGADDGKAIGQC